MDDGADDRRAFFKEAFRSSARALNALVDGSTAAAADLEPWPWASAARSPDPGVDMRALADAAGLGHRATEIETLLRVSFRLSPSRARRSIRQGSGQAPIQVSLGADAAGRANLPSGGTFMIDFDVDETEIGRARVRFEPGAARTRATVFGAMFDVSQELVLPRGWTDSVDALGLPFEEREQWESLRLALAETQQVHPPDSTDQSHRLGRLLGYPDDRSGAMPARCEEWTKSRLRGTDSTSPWTLLLQVPLPRSRDPRQDRRTAFLWMRADALAAMDFAEVCAIVP